MVYSTWHLLHTNIDLPHALRPPYKLDNVTTMNPLGIIPTSYNNDSKFPHIGDKYLSERNKGNQKNLHKTH